MLNPEVVERQIIEMRTRVESESMDTLRSLTDYSNYLGFESEQAFRKLLAGKVICDIGSGYDGLSIDAIKNGLNTRIISVNPGRALAGFKEKRAQVVEGSGWFAGDFSSILDQVDLGGNSNANYAHDLKDIGNESIDIMLDVLGMSFNIDPDFRQLYKKSLVEMISKVKPGGVMYIADSTIFNGRNDDRSQKSMKLSTLETLGHNLMPLIAPRDSQKLGVVLFKAGSSGSRR